MKNKSEVRSQKSEVKKSMRFIPRRAGAGFTLIELAIVLAIIGLLIGMGATLIGPLTKRAQLHENREIVKTAHEALLGYAGKNKALPANLSSLGIKTTDVFGRDLFYNGIGFSNLCTSTGAYITVNDNSSGTSQTKSNVAFILLAEGENRANNTGAASPFTIQVQNDNYDDIVMYADIDKIRSQVCTAFRITTESLPSGEEEMVYPSTTLEATDGTTPYTWTKLAGSLPPVLDVSGAGVISGTPTADGSYNFTLQVKDSDNPKRVATKSLTITINPNKPTITTEFLAFSTVNQAYPSTTLSATGGKPSYTWTMTAGSLPPGMSLSGAGGISGTPTAPGTYSFTARATDGRARTADKTLSIAINPER